MNSCILSETAIGNKYKCQLLYKVNVHPKQRRGKKKVWKGIKQYIRVRELFPSFTTACIMQRLHQIIQTCFFLFHREEYVPALKL